MDWSLQASDPLGFVFEFPLPPAEERLFGDGIRVR